MDTNEFTAEDHVIGRRSHHVAREPVSDGAKPAVPERLRCADVARNRARRYVKRHRIAKPFWPLIATAIVIGLILERRPISSAIWIGKRAVSDHDNGRPRPLFGQTLVHDERDPVAQPSPKDTGRTLNDHPKPKYRPPEQFLARDVAQMIAFLSRNRGRQDNDVIRARWKIIDDFSLPLAVYLREIEALGAWSEVNAETSAVMLDPSIRLPKGMPRSLRHQKIVALLPEWQRRGEKLLTTIDGSGGTNGGLTPNTAPDEPDGPSDDDDKPPLP